MLSATATYGSLGTYAHLSITGFPYQSYFVPGSGNPTASCGTYGIGLDAAAGEAEFPDHFTVTGGSGDVYVISDFGVEGTSRLPANMCGFASYPGSSPAGAMPEPATILFVAPGLIFLVASRRRRRLFRDVPIG